MDKSTVHLIGERGVTVNTSMHISTGATTLSGSWSSSRSLGRLFGVHRLSSNDGSRLPRESIDKGSNEGEEATILSAHLLNYCNAYRNTHKAMKMNDSLVNFKLQEPPKGAFSSHWLSL